MLVVHPSSTCDVCLDGYNWTTPANAPHAIACGHVFCLQCLHSLNPSNCPLCRKAFQPDRIKKLHVDRIYPGQDQDVTSEETELLQRVALYFGENTSVEDVNAVIDEVNAWLGARPDNDGAHRSLRSAADGLRDYWDLQRQLSYEKEEHRETKQSYRQRLQLKDDDLKKAHLVEQNLLEQMENAEKEWKMKLTRANAEIALLRSEQVRSHDRRKLERPEVQVPRLDLSRSEGASNALPQLPRTASPERIPSVMRSNTSSSRRSSRRTEPTPGPSGSANTIRSQTRRLSSPGPFPGPSSILQEGDDESRRDRSLLPPLIVPGARPHEKIVPPRPDGWFGSFKSPSATINSRSTRLSNATPPSASAGAGPSSVSPTAYGWQYGAASDGRYGYYTAPWPQPSRAVSAVDNAGAPSSSLSNPPRPLAYPTYASTSYTAQQPIAGPSGTNRSDSSGSHTVRNAPAMPRRTPSGRSRREDTISSSRTPRGDAVETSQPHEEPLSSATLNSMTLLNPPPNPQMGDQPPEVNERRDLLDLLRDSSPAPSPASTWGTINSSDLPSRNSASSDLSVGDLGLIGLPNDSASSLSVGDLGLVGLPSGSRELLTDSEDDEPAVIPPPNLGEDDDLQTTTPTSRPFARSAGSETSLLRPQMGNHDRSAGLGFNAGIDHSASHEIISGPQDLRFVSDSLLQFANEDSTSRGGRASQADHRSRRSSHSNADDAPDTIVGARTGLALYSSRPQSRPDEYGASSSQGSSTPSSHRFDRGSMSDSEHVGAGYVRDQSRTSERRRHTTMADNVASSPHSHWIPETAIPQSPTVFRSAHDIAPPWSAVRSTAYQPNMSYRPVAPPFSGTNSAYRLAGDVIQPASVLQHAIPPSPPNQTSASIWAHYAPPTPSIRGSTSRRTSTSSRVSDRQIPQARYGSPPNSVLFGAAPEAPTISTSDGFVPSLGQSSLLLSFPAASSTSGENSAIHAPAPRSAGSQHNSLQQR
ncbi:uncharacterized protein LAESUDRAFT_729000 [Laetiporus sulphureus 93-53]|uniref:RING-type domain-containing protein n=1 Tax=Laetiporus sulphureus 93-53 TaxID=1314785 RepID=A0A165CXW0_9APHY|nr:uncharacterized protein LAESUDRAFT_729000 [Laetiporus sulphureus 93-53]KZT03701.1 hypothetical protein LAESUDRAFT_729000 [Laetiporus sulphureus 93-53]